MKHDDKDVYLEESGWESSSIRSSRSFLNNAVMLGIFTGMDALSQVLRVIHDKLEALFWWVGLDPLQVDKVKLSH